MAKYRPLFRRQLGDPTTGYDSYICTFESGAMALDFHTLGKLRVWGGTLLNRLRLTSANIKDGLNLYDLQRAWATYGKWLTVKTGGTWADVIKARNEGRGIILQGDHDQLSAYERCSAFMGNHAVYLNPEWKTGYTLMGNPLCTGFKWASNVRLRTYAEDLGRQARLGKTASGQQKIFFAVTAAHLPPPPITTTPYGTPAFKVSTKNLKYLWIRRADGKLVKHTATVGFNFTAETTSNRQKLTVNGWTGTFRRITNGSHAGAYIHMVKGDTTVAFTSL